MPEHHQLDLSVCLITFNEEGHLADCLASLPSGCEIIVVDSGSTDRTRDIAEAAGATFVERRFDDYASQKNSALALATRSWLFSVDADERLSPNLRGFLSDVSSLHPDTYYTVERRLVFLGRKMRFGRTSDRPIRLAPRARVEFVGVIHERMQPVQSLKLCHLKDGNIWHYSYDSLSDYFERFNRYTSEIAEKKWRANPQEQITLQLAIRPWWEFLSRYIFRLGFLDGYPGYCYALISSLYVFTKYAKYRERLDQGDKVDS